MVMAEPIRILLLADTHLGFDLPFRPRIKRRRRGHDFFANFERALEPAIHGEVDMVVHGGDLLYRTKVPPALVDMALSPLVRVAELGVPVYLVPGNHERSRIPLQLWGHHPNLHIFDKPRTYLGKIKGAKLAIVGFPFIRKVRDLFTSQLDQTGYQELDADLNLLCIHQAVEGAQVGPSNYTFRRGADVIRGRDIPGNFLAVLSGHIHRAQTLTHDLSGSQLAAPVIYPGSIERTSFAERNEGKGYQLITLHTTSSRDIRLQVFFKPLPARPMLNLHLDLEAKDAATVEGEIKEKLLAMDPNSIVRVHIRNSRNINTPQSITTSRLRELAPESMNITLATGGEYNRRRE